MFLVFSQDDVEKFVAEKRKTRSGLSIEDIIKELQESYQKYKFMESRLAAQSRAVSLKIPDIKSALETLAYLIQQKEEGSKIETKYKLAETLYMNAELTEPRTVFLWLGAKVMLEYEYDEAVELLSKNLKSAESNLETLKQDLDFLKDQVTVSEVNIARMHNYNVKLKKSNSSSK